ncbi:class I SAM-dependent methyltransferase [Nocardia alni]|uniref:class I SAM-dependent methyltransferase n=1 Tax=Nocardia alni TaxID=2815723 RepID=UPI001C22D346|nr:class I SAM-dependent methyltransferase [Nocardia alni]
MTHAVDRWNAAYDNDTAPWVIGEPQPEILALERDGWIRGRVLDAGCGAGEHTIALTALGHDVFGVDLSPSALAHARRNAAGKGISAARFELADMVAIGDDPDLAAELGVFDTIVDSALFHIFREDDQARASYERALRRLCAPGGRVHVLALSDVEEGFGPRVSDQLIRESFGAGWELEELRPARYRGRVTETVAERIPPELKVAADGTVDAQAWLARFLRR